MKEEWLFKIGSEAIVQEGQIMEHGGGGLKKDENNGLLFTKIFRYFVHQNLLLKLVHSSSLAT